MFMKDTLARTEEFVRAELMDESTGHDWHHIDRVRKNAKLIAQKLGVGDLFIIEMAALLHDIPDEKLNESEKQGWDKLLEHMDSLNLPEDTAAHILACIESVSFKGGRKVELKTIEAKIVQDADRLDALGAIGIARTFAYGGKKGNPIYEPEFQVRDGMSLEDYRNGQSSSVHHFYEKLFKLKDLMNTDEAREIAQQRHEYMAEFLEQFYSEWNGNA
nr:HD domain-containing protein [Mesobacillus campisalis]